MDRSLHAGAVGIGTVLMASTIQTQRSLKLNHLMGDKCAGVFKL